MRSKLSDISHNDVSKLHSTVGWEHGQYAANHLLRLLRHMFNCAPAMGTKGSLQAGLSYYQKLWIETA